ncbi:hypothetical protein [Microbulbifer sp. SAOS-129_SWC]|uniref:hypothetical protein n=1 Tax=Microbulbifer sp. SAOS-129_SWC TaxID=3145235 RepID=UPI003216C2DA
MIFGSEKNPKGPAFKKARPIEKNLSGIKLCFRAPPSSDPLSSIEEWESEPASRDIYDLSVFRPLNWIRKSGERHEFKEIQMLRAYSSRWGFRGLPIIEGYCGYINFLIDVNFVDDLPVNETLFENQTLAREAYRSFELTELSDTHKGHSDDPMDLTPYSWPSYLGPINSQWQNLGNSDWFYFESQPLVNDSEMITWNTAITDKHYLSCRFIINRSARNAGNSYQIEQRVPRNNFIEFANQVMETISIELPLDMLKRRAQIQAQIKANEKVILTCTRMQVEEAKHVLYMWSDREYEAPGKGEDDDHRADPDDVAAFVDERIKPRPLPNSYPPGEVLNLESQANTAEAESG